MDNCTFYLKIGTCRHGDKCSKKHIKPTASRVLYLPNMYPGSDIEGYLTDVIAVIGQIAPINELMLSGNTNEHLKGSLYLKFRNEADAQKVCDKISDRWYAGRPLLCELSPINELSSACCRQSVTNECDRGSNCNYVHPMDLPSDLVRRLFESQANTWISSAST